MEDALQFSWSWGFVLRSLSITLIDLALSGDNAIVIGMAAACLPGRRRKWAIMVGGGLAILLRISLVTIVTLLMQIQLLSAIGGCALFWVSWKLLRMDIGSAIEKEKEANQAQNFRQAILIILVADFMMSLDNVIAIAGLAHGQIVLLIVGLLISMPLLMTTGGVISALSDKFRWLIYLGSAVIIFTGSRMIFEDRFIEARLPVPAVISLTVSVFMGIALTVFFVWINQRRIKLLAAKFEAEVIKQ
ncbi:MAG: YjbE family putative metal transport protein [Chloroflexi bacterium]|nr:YjbE family putative metal transport protein [Chloroflexota bacterium]